MKNSVLLKKKKIFWMTRNQIIIENPITMRKQFQ
jgi:hypothetical protein